MNKRIKELAEQATSTLSMNHEGYRGKGYIEQVEYFDKEKFAELIVKDCLDIAFEVRGKPATDTHYVIGYDRACEKMISGIREHFGVEE